MRRFLDNLVARMELWAMKNNEVARFDVIGLVDFRRHGDSFAAVIESSLRLVQERDARRYARLKKHVSWISNQVTIAMGAQYQFHIRACNLEFDDMREVHRDVVIAFYACILVHEATHGVLASRGIKMTSENRVQVERLCTTEQNRFAKRLSVYDPARYPRELMLFDFDERYWDQEWKMGGTKQSISFVSRWLADRRTD